MAAPRDAELLNEKIALVVDDEKFSRSLVIRHLDALGVVIAYEAMDGEEGLYQLGEEWRSIDLIVSDFEMPMMNGLEFVRAVRSGANGLRNDTPIIMLTGHTDAKLVSTAMSLDVDAFIVKPVSRDTLAARIRKIYGAARDVKPPAFYAKVDVKPFAHGTKKPPAPAPKKPLPAVAPPKPAGRVVALEALEAPAVLAQDICLSNGVVLVEAGTKMSARLIEHLRELSALGITKIWIE